MLHSSRLTQLALTIALVVGAPLVSAAEPAAPASRAAVPATEVTAKAPLPLDELRTFAEVLDRIKAAYVEPVDDKTLLENAIKGMLSNLGVKLDQRGNVEANVKNYRTSLDKIFAAGDMRRGQSLVVWAIREGRQAARAVDEYLMGESLLPR